MSGIEVAGLVLGALPLIITALETYKSTVSKVSKWRCYEREVHRLVVILNCENVRLQSICEKLLEGGSVARTVIAAMIEDPGGPLWKDNGLRQKLELSWRVWDSGENLLGMIEDVKGSLDEIKDKLKLEDGKVQWSERRIQREFKRASFTLDSADYKELLDRVTTGVTRIERILNANIAREPPRRSWSQYRYYKALRNISSNLYQAFRYAFVCQCLDSHSVDLALGRPLDIVLRGDEEDQTRVLQAIRFQVAVTYKAKSSDPRSGTLRDVLKVCPLLPPRPLLVATQNSLNRSTTSSGTKKSVRFSAFSVSSTPKASAQVEKSSATLALAQGALHIPKMLTFPSPSLQQDTPRLVDLCQAIQASNSKIQLEASYGYICDDKSANVLKYQLFPTCAIEKTKDAVSLGDILRDTPGTWPHLSLRTKFYLAFVLSSSFLQLHETGWLPGPLTHESVFFMKRNGSVGSPPYRDVFISKSLSDTTTSGKIPGSPAMTYNAPLFSLGILLIELMLETPFQELMETTQLSTSHRHDIPQHVKERKVAMQLLEQGRIQYEPYKNAVLHCIDNDSDQSLEDDGTQQELYSFVVKLMEEELRKLETPMYFQS